jgi:phosphatidylserine/phosphatidylglycerophosphate/cardiolipin synthase-like enzyme
MWMPFKDAYPDRVHLLLRKDHAFVHSKMIIVDDVYVHCCYCCCCSLFILIFVFNHRYALIGSANIGRRSFTSDPEIGAAVVDENIVTRKDGSDVQVAEFAYHTRVKSWAEMTGEDDLESYYTKPLDEQIAMFSSFENSGVDDVAKLPLKKGTSTGSAVLDLEVCELFDPQSRCTEEDLDEDGGFINMVEDFFSGLW